MATWAAGALATLFLLPVVWAVVESLREPAGVSFAAYVRACDGLDISSAMANTCLLAMGGTALIVSTSAAFGFALSESRPSIREIARIVLLILVMLPKQFSLVALIRIVELLSLQGTLTGIALCLAAGGMPLLVLIYEASFRARCAKHSAVLKVLGVRPIERFGLLLPMVSGTSKSLVLLEVLRMATTFFYPLVLSLGHRSQQPLTVRLYELGALYPGDTQRQLAAGILVSVPGLILLGCIQFNREFRSRTSASVTGEPPGAVG